MRLVLDFGVWVVSPPFSLHFLFRVYSAHPVISSERATRLLFCCCRSSSFLGWGCYRFNFDSFRPSCSVQVLLLVPCRTEPLFPVSGFCYLPPSGCSLFVSATAAADEVVTIPPFASCWFVLFSDFSLVDSSGGDGWWLLRNSMRYIYILRGFLPFLKKTFRFGILGVLMGGFNFPGVFQR